MIDIPSSELCKVKKKIQPIDYYSLLSNKEWW